MSEHVRLHISPLTPELLPKIIPFSILPSVSIVSYHSIETFPERAYGFLELPAMAAEKLKKKVNGSILKGSKIKVEEARERKTRSQDKKDAAAEPMEGDQEVQPSKKAKKRKREEGVLSGFELPEERKVKRGWTEPTAPVNERKYKGDKAKKEGKTKKKRERSAYTDQPECLFKTSIPPNVTETNRARDDKRKKREGNKDTSETVIHEFEHTTKHANFLRSGSGAPDTKQVAGFDESKGWVDEEGNVIEPSRKSRAGAASSAKESTKGDNLEATNETSRMGSLSLHEQDEDEARKAKKQGQEVGGEENDEDETSSSGSSSSESDPESDSNPSEIPEASEPLAPIATSSLEASPSEAPKSTPHPLETIFKRPQASNSSGTPIKPSLEVTPVPFSFFGNDDNNNTPGSASTTTSKTKRTSRPPNLNIPQTPFTAHDRQWRAQRSAAPTPDTAAPNRSVFGSAMGWHGRREDDIDEDDEEETNDDNDGGKGGGMKQRMAKSVEDPDNDDDDDDDDDDDANEDDSSDDNELDNEDDSDDEGDTSNDTPSGPSKTKGNPSDKEGKKPESEFATWFWEHRGENNRAWKQRRREAIKEKKKQEKKRTGSKRSEA